MAPPACDRCSRRKEKCHFDDGAASCRRCSQHQTKCSFDRRQRRIGRRPAAKSLPYGLCEVLNLEPPMASPPYTIDNGTSPANSDSGVSKSWPTSGVSIGETPSTPSSCACQPSGNGQTSAKNHNSVVLEVLNDRDTFYVLHQQFMIGRSFADRFQAAIWAVSPHADNLLFDAYQAVLSLWDIQHHRIKALGEVDVTAGTECLRVLQNTTTVRREDAPAILMVGQILLVYHIVAMCTSAYSILRSALLAVRPFYDDLLSQQHLDPITITPIFIDTIESLVRREAPVIRGSVCDRFIVDRTVGLCWTLIPLLQELCDCSAQSRTSGVLTTSSPGGVSDLFTDVEYHIKLWEPRPPPSVFSDYTTPEINVMLLQARVYRVAALLLIHRLRYPLGERDEEALPWANMILAELSGFIAWVPEDMRGVPIGLPLLVAMLEIRGTGEHIIPQMATFATHPRHASEFRRFVSLVWAAREGGFRGLWFDLATSFQIPIVP